MCQKNPRWLSSAGKTRTAKVVTRFFCAPERTTANLVRLAGIEPTTLGFGGQI
jgi:hypothetical protein